MFSPTLRTCANSEGRGSLETNVTYNTKECLQLQGSIGHNAHVKKMAICKSKHQWKRNEAQI